MSEPNPNSGRRSYTVRLRALMLLIAVAALGLGWRVNRAHTQARAVARVKAAGGHVWYDYQLDGDGSRKANASRSAPAQLRRLLGDEFFQEVAAVTFRGQTTDDQLAPVEDLDRLGEFNLLVSDSEKRITDAGLAHLRRLKGLRIVRIEDAHVNDAGLGHLADLPHLQELFLLHIDGITDAGWAGLAKMTELHELLLGGAGMTCAGTRHLAGLTKLQNLDIFSSPVTDAGLVWLEDLKALRTLSLSATAISDAGLAHLEGLTALQDLDLSYNRISDQGVRHLRGLCQLRKLNLDFTGVTNEAVAELKAGHPGLVVSLEKSSWTIWTNP